jgi:hypothetical protein
MWQFWQDQKRSPGPLPQGNRRALAIRLLVAAALLVAINSIHSRVALGSFVVLIGLGGLYTVARLNQRRLDEMRYMRGPGWWIGVLVSKTSVPVARASWTVMSLAICALGIADLALWKH